MASAADHSRTLFAAIVPNRRDLLETVLTQLSEEHFTDETWLHIFKIFEFYYQKTNGVATKEAVAAIVTKLSSSDMGKVRMYEAIYDSLEQREVSSADFKWALSEIKEIFEVRATKIALTEAMNVLTKGIEGPRGTEIKGATAARERIVAKFGEIDLRTVVQEAPDGDAREEEDDILAEYASKKELFVSGESPGIDTGIPSLDRYIGGFQPGELDFVLGYSSSGKSSMCVQIGWWTAFMQHKNVVYVTTETLRNQIRRKAICRHSKLSKFGIDDGLNSLDLKLGRLNDRQEAQLREVVHDFAHGDNYGKFRLMQATESMTLSTLNIKLQAIQREYPIDLLIIDALYLLKPEEKRSKEREELNGMIQKVKNLATSFDNGNGLPIITPWQTSREHKERADRDKRYSMAAMAETSYAERYADVVLSLLEPQQVQRHTTLTCALIKCRDGEQSPNLEVDVDYATSSFVDSGRAQSMSTNMLIGI